MLQWNDPVSFIHGLTTHQRKLLQNIDIETVGDLLQLPPRRYDDYSQTVRVADLRDGVPVTVRATVQEVAKVPTFRKRFVIIRALLSDGTGSVKATWFNQPWLVQTLQKGAEIFVSGAVTMRPRFGRGFTNPLWEPVSEETVAAGTVAPVYPLSGSLTQKTLRKIIQSTLKDVSFPADPLPSDVRSRYSLPDLEKAINDLHHPSVQLDAHRARARLAFDELLVYQLALRTARAEADRGAAPAIAFDEMFAKKFTASLPFALTEDQKRAVWAAVKDMGETRPMRRLLQGDVGSGKTAVAAMLMALVARSNGSAVFMAPTDILAKQHAETLRRFFRPLGLPVLLFTSSARGLFEGGEEKTLTLSEARARCRQGRILVVGTHAVLEPGQRPPDVALAVVDEQHRFGVVQRETLVVATREDGRVPHLLSMSATPIPRSLALTLFGDLECSVIRTKPAGRLPVATRLLLGTDQREEAYHMIRQEVASGRQAFIVCPLIDPSDAFGAKSVEEEAKRLALGPLRGMRIAVLHGRMNGREKDEVMNRFAAKQEDVLVATTVVEVGVDVPNATVMMIEGAERFGLAQLHQLRGRVGRSSLPSFCFLAVSDDATGSVARLRVMEQTNDGFAVAEADLRNRGEGNLFGVQQSGSVLFRFSTTNDLELMVQARECAAELMQKDPDLATHPTLKEKVKILKENSHRE